MGIWIALGIGLIAICIIFGIITRKNFNNGLQENIDNEIKEFLDEKQDSDYQFKDKDLEKELREQLKTAMIDWRSSGYRYKISYIRRTTTKQREIYSIINRYYWMDKKEHL